MLIAILSGCNQSARSPAADPVARNSTIENVKSTEPAERTISIQTLPALDFPTPDTTTQGTFALNDNCLTFVTGEGQFRAVLPFGSKFVAPDAVMMGSGGQVPIGELVVVKGAEGNFGLASEIPSGCPAKSIVIGGLAR